jgi:cytosine/uracil/thiamine/allantoin permease
MAFGMRGTYIPIFIVFVGGFVYVSHAPGPEATCFLLAKFKLTVVKAGIQAYYGGQAMALMLGAVFPSFNNMKNTLPAAAAITTKDLIGFMIFAAVYCPILLVIRPHQLRLGLYEPFFSSHTILFVSFHLIITPYLQALCIDILHSLLYSLHFLVSLDGLLWLTVALETFSRPL